MYVGESKLGQEDVLLFRKALYIKYGKWKTIKSNVYSGLVSLITWSGNLLEIYTGRLDDGYFFWNS